MIKFHYGPIGSGKSQHLISSYINELRRRPDGEVCLLKPASDTRTAGVFTRFGNIEVEPDIRYGDSESRLQWLLALDKKKAFFLDEVQFLPEDMIKEIFWKRKSGQIFFLYGLKNDYLGTMWNSVQVAMNIADEIIEIPTFCEVCNKRKASFNRKDDKTLEGNQVGFHYTPVCWKCFKG